MFMFSSIFTLFSNVSYLRSLPFCRTNQKHLWRCCAFATHSYTYTLIFAQFAMVRTKKKAGLYRLFACLLTDSVPLLHSDDCYSVTFSKVISGHWSDFQCNCNWLRYEEAQLKQAAQENFIELPTHRNCIILSLIAFSSIFLRTNSMGASK